MDSYITGATIRALREKQHLTQAQLAEKLRVSDKTISKWETGRGLPDVTLLEPLAAVCGVSLAELMSGAPVYNTNVSANMLRSVFYVCPICGNILHSTGSAVMSCHGITLPPLEAEDSDEADVQPVEDEYYVTLPHPMTREHHLTFMAAVSYDRLTLVRLYPEGDAAVRLPRRGTALLYYHCNRDGLFRQRLHK